MDLERPKHRGTQGDRTQVLTATELLPEEGKFGIPRGTRSLALSKEALRMRQKGCDRSHGSQQCQRVYGSSAVPWGQPELRWNTPCSTKTAGRVGTQPKHQAADPLRHWSQRKGAKQLCWERAVFLAQNMPRDLQRPELAKTSSDTLLPGQSLRIPVASLRSEARTTYCH